MRNLTIHYRNSLFGEEKEAALSAGFLCTDLLSSLGEKDLVIPRYTTLPFALDYFRELDNLGAECINTFSQHRIMADLFIWTKILRELTPKTYNQYDMPYLPEGAYVLKGATNSKKAYWNTHMFAPTKKDVPRIFANLVDDSLIGNQEIAIREYVPLKELSIGINDMPITKEYRYFILNNKVISKGFYWQNYVDDLEPKDVELKSSKKLNSFLEKVMSRLNDYLTFYCVDIGLTTENKWVVIEINDATMAGLSCIDPKEFYKNLYESCKSFK